MRNDATRWLVEHSLLTDRQIGLVRAALIVGGLAAFALGIVIWAWPGATLMIVAWAFGLFFIVSGLVRIGMGVALRDATTLAKVVTVIIGVIIIVTGVIVLVNPDVGIVALATLVGIVWVIEGVGALTTLPAGSLKWLALIYGVLSVVGGILVILSPAFAAGVMLLFAASFLVVGGMMQVLEGIVFARGRDRPTVS